MRDRVSFAVIWCLVGMAAAAQDASVTGTVRDSSTKAPIPGASIQLHRMPKDEVRTAITGMDGSYRFEGLSPSRYTVLWKADGYTGANPGIAMRAFILASGAEERHVLELVPISSIAGTVIDEEGEPIRGANVYVGGSLRATTDEKGAYRIQPIMPGKYTLAVRVPNAFRDGTLDRNPDTDEVFGYPIAEYYPGTADFAAATPIAIAGRLDLHGFDVRLRRVRLVHIAGHVIERVGGDIATGVRVGLENPASGFLDESLKPRPVDDQGGFRFENLPEGRYAVAVYRADEDDGALPYLAPVETGKAGIDGLKVVLPPFRSFEVVTKTDDDVGWTGRLRLNLGATSTTSLMRDRTLTPEPVNIGVIPPGKWWAYVSGDAHTADGRALTTDRITLGTEEAVGKQLVVGESGESTIVVHLTAGAGTIAGTVLRVDGKLGNGGLLIARREGDSIMVPGAPSGLTLVKDDGSFTITGLLPGVYRVSGDSTEGGRYLAKLEVKAGETTRVQLSPVKE